MKKFFERFMGGDKERGSFSEKPVASKELEVRGKLNRSLVMNKKLLEKLKGEIEKLNGEIPMTPEDKRLYLLKIEDIHAQRNAALEDMEEAINLTRDVFGVDIEAKRYDLIELKKVFMNMEDIKRFDIAA